MPANQRPTDPAKFFMTWLGHAAPRVVPPFAMDLLRQHFPRRSLAFYATDGIAGVMGDGRLLGFVPLHLLAGRPVKGVVGHRIRGRLPAEPGPLDAWVRTRFGYAEGHGPMLQGLQQRSLGDFARPPL